MYNSCDAGVYNATADGSMQPTLDSVVAYINSAHSLLRSIHNRSERKCSLKKNCCDLNSYTVHMLFISPAVENMVSLPDSANVGALEIAAEHYFPG